MPRARQRKVERFEPVTLGHIRGHGCRDLLVYAPPRPFISEDDLSTFEGWLNYQGFDAAQLSASDLAMWRDTFDQVKARSSADPKVGLMRLRPTPGLYRYAIALRTGTDLWLTLWVKRNPAGEFFVFRPTRDDRNVHASYHRDGRFHMKSHGRIVGQPRQLQALTGTFRGTEHLGAYGGHGPKGVGAICDPSAFHGVVEAPPGVLGPVDGQVVVDLVEPGCEPLEWPVPVVQQQVFRDVVPWVVIRICRNA
jgi:hypothetical protein